MTETHVGIACDVPHTRHAAGCPDAPGYNGPPPAGPPNYAALNALMDMIFETWEHLENENAATIDSEAADLFECIIGRIASLREWTGWDGVPGKYTR